MLNAWFLSFTISTDADANHNIHPHPEYNGISMTGTLHHRFTFVVGNRCSAPKACCLHQKSPRQSVHIDNRCYVQALKLLFGYQS